MAGAVFTEEELSKKLSISEATMKTLCAVLFPMKAYYTYEDAIIIRDWYSRWGLNFPDGAGAFHEYQKLERMKLLLNARLQVIEERQSECVSRLFFENEDHTKRELALSKPSVSPLDRVKNLALGRNGLNGKSGRGYWPPRSG